jgi:hypothetical protein
MLNSGDQPQYEIHYVMKRTKKTQFKNSMIKLCNFELLQSAE